MHTGSKNFLSYCFIAAEKVRNGIGANGKGIQEQLRNFSDALNESE